jgi:hypothetical protein
MHVTQFDIAHLNDDLVKIIVVNIDKDFPEGHPGPATGIMRAFALALVRALRERRLTIRVAEEDLLNADVEEGAQIPDGEDPVAYSLGDLDGWEPS